MKKHIGKTLKVLVEGKTFDNQYYTGRSYMDVPEIDGTIYIKAKDRKLLKEGEFVNCTVIDIDDYDLICKLQ